jgi:ribosomal protein L17
MAWPKGTSGNSAGRKKGAATRIVAEIQAIVAKDAKPIVESIVAQAKAGDVESRRAFVKLLPQGKWPTPFDLPPIKGPADLPIAVQAVLAATAAGDLSLEDGERIVGLLSGLRAAYESAAMVERMNDMDPASS